MEDTFVGRDAGVSKDGFVGAGRDFLLPTDALKGEGFFEGFAFEGDLGGGVVGVDLKGDLDFGGRKALGGVFVGGDSERSALLGEIGVFDGHRVLAGREVGLPERACFASFSSTRIGEADGGAGIVRIDADHAVSDLVAESAEFGGCGVFAFVIFVEFFFGVAFKKLKGAFVKSVLLFAGLSFGSEGKEAGGVEIEAAFFDALQTLQRCGWSDGIGLFGEAFARGFDLSASIEGGAIGLGMGELWKAREAGDRHERGRKGGAEGPLRQGVVHGSFSIGGSRRCDLHLADRDGKVWSGKVMGCSSQGIPRGKIFS